MKSILTVSILLTLATAASIGSAQTAPPPPAVPATPPALQTPPAVRPATPVVPPATSAVPPAPIVPPTPKLVSRDAYGNAVAAGTATPSNPAPAQSSMPPVVTPFATLDSGNSDVIKHDQAGGDAWLSQHFSQCDVNHDNEITQGEYAACSRVR